VSRPLGDDDRLTATVDQLQAELANLSRQNDLQMAMILAVALVMVILVAQATKRRS
jgi:hypothetical protein